MIKVAINGYGRIGRLVLRALYENNFRDKIQIVAINDLASAQMNMHLTKYDSVHGKFAEEISLAEDVMTVNGDDIKVFQQADPENLPWNELDVDIVFECSGFFKSKQKSSKHIKAGANKVIISAPATDVDATVVYGVNNHVLTSETHIISNASCTTNCLAPVVKILNDKLGIKKGHMTTIHAYTGDQNLIDVAHADIYRARSATQSMIPTKTGAAAAVGLVLPELKGKLDGMAIRVPTINVSLVDLHFVSHRDTTVEEVNQLIADAANGSMKGIIEYITEPLVSIDINHNSASSCFDPAHTKVNGDLVKIMTWYDNEWAFSVRMLDTALALMAVA